MTCCCWLFLHVFHTVFKHHRHVNIWKRCHVNWASVSIKKICTLMAQFLERIIFQPQDSCFLFPFCTITEFQVVPIGGRALFMAVGAFGVWFYVSVYFCGGTQWVVRNPHRFLSRCMNIRSGLCENSDPRKLQAFCRASRPTESWPSHVNKRKQTCYGCEKCLVLFEVKLSDPLKALWPQSLTSSWKFILEAKPI